MHVYQKKTKEMREKREETRTTPSVEFRIDTSHTREKVKSTSVPLLEPVKLADALSLKDQVPEHDKYGMESQGQDESFKSDRIEFVVVEREVEDGEEAIVSGSDQDYEWEIPERSSFAAIMGHAIDKYTETDWDCIDFLTFSSVGWNTGVGLFAFGSDKLEQMNIFRGILRTLRIGNKCFEAYPKRMLLNQYTLTIYLNTANRGCGHGVPFGTRRGRFRQNFGPSRASPAFPSPGHGRGIYDIYAHDPYEADSYYHGAEPGLYQEDPWSLGKDHEEWL